MTASNVTFKYSVTDIVYTVIYATRKIRRITVMQSYIISGAIYYNTVDAMGKYGYYREEELFTFPQAKAALVAALEKDLIAAQALQESDSV